MRARFLVLMATILVAGALRPEAPHAQTAETPSHDGLFRASVLVESQVRAQRLDQLDIQVLVPLAPGEGVTWAILATEAQLEALVRLGFAPERTEAVSSLFEQNRGSALGVAEESLLQAADAVGRDSNPSSLARLHEAQSGLDLQSKVELAQIASTDQDGDGLTNTQETWWCTDPLSQDSDNDGVSDGDEVSALKRWVSNEILGTAGGFSRAPQTGKPFAGWPPATGVSGEIPCQDDDRDGVPDSAERWELGLNPNRESTDLDKFDDGQELFGVTNCPGSGGFCGYGALPRDAEFGLVTSNMPSFVKAPGNHPLVAAFPIPEVDVVPSSVRVTATTTITSSNTVTEGTERSYSTSKTEGTSTSVADTVTWNSWQETSLSQSASSASLLAERRAIDSLVGAAVGACLKFWAFCSSAITTSAGWIAAQHDAAQSEIVVGIEQRDGKTVGVNHKGEVVSEERFVTLPADIGGINLDGVDLGNRCVVGAGGVTPADCPPATALKLAGNSNTADFSSVCADCTIDSRGQLVLRAASAPPVPPTQTSIALNSVIRLDYPAPSFVPTRTESTGSSRGGAQTTTHETYEEHTVTNGEAFLNQTAWGTATAENSGHAADLRFSYSIRNAGTEYARELGGIVFNVFLGDDETPLATYFVAPDVGGDGLFHNLMPGESHTFTSGAIPLTLEQMRTLDLGGTLRVVAEDFTYGIDELFYADASDSGVMIAIEDGTDDGDENIDRYLIPTWELTPGVPETALDVAARYFPHTTDDPGQLVAIWTPEYRSDTPSWCDQPKTTGSGSTRALWCRHALSTADWWNVYTDGLGDGSEGLQDSIATPGALALFRFNKDSDLDGYSDRSERSLGTSPTDATSFPHPELLAGLHCVGTSSQTCTLSLLNTGIYDAYGVEAVMVSPDSTTTITNNTVGGSGRVRAQHQVIVGSRVALAQPLPSAWGQPGHASPSAGGYYTGTVDRTYSFTVSCGLGGGCLVGQGSWSLNWTDGTGDSGSVPFGTGYASPTFGAAGPYGLTVAMQSGRVFNGETFSVHATTPRDTFQYSVTGPVENHTRPIVIVSYNDPQGNHRFALPPATSSLSAPTDNLAGFTGQMLGDPGVEIFTSGPFVAGANSTTLIANNPTGTTLTGAQLHLVFVDDAGNPVLEVTQSATLAPGPTLVPVAWNSGSFSPAYDPAKDYLVLAFLTDSEGNILDAGGRPLSSFQADPVPQAAFAAGGLTWDFGTAARGTLLSTRIGVGSVGARELLAAIDATGAGVGLTVTGPDSGVIGPGDVGEYHLFLDTALLPEGAYSNSLPFRTSDDGAPVSLSISGTITAPLGPLDSAGGVTLRPLDMAVTVTGTQAAGTSLDFPVPSSLGDDPQSLHPAKVYSDDYTVLKGLGQYATAFGSSGTSADVFGTGRDGTFNGGDPNTVRHALTAGVSAASSLIALTSSAGLAVGDEVLLIQMQGSLAGRYEFGTIAGIAGSNVTLTQPVSQAYDQGGASRSQLIKVPHFSQITGSITTTEWNGSVGGVLVFRAFEATSVSLNMSAKGFKGGYGNDQAIHSGGICNFGSGDGQGQQGHSPTGVGGCSKVPNGGGGGGAGNQSFGGGFGSGGGGGYATNGGSGSGNHPGGGGVAFGDQQLTTIFLGPGGGGGDWGTNPYGGGRSSVAGGDDDGQGGGIIIVFARTGAGISAQSNGNNGGASSNGYAGGGGAGGSIKLTVGSASLGTVQAAGGPAGAGGVANGGPGGQGRTLIEYCDSVTGVPATDHLLQPIECFIAEQVDQAPYSTLRLSLPDATPPDVSYNVQYGRRYVYASGGEQTRNIRFPGGIVDSATFDLLVSGLTGASTVSVDIGDNGSLDWTPASISTSAAALTSPDLAAQFNAILSGAGAGSVDIPVRVVLSGPGEVLFTNLLVGGTASTIQFIRVPDATYSDFNVSLLVGSSGSGSVAASFDIGDNGSIDAVFSGDVTFPQKIASANVASAVNAYLAANPGAQVDVPVRVFLTPDITRRLVGFSASLASRPDFTLSAIGLPGGGVTEGQSVAVSVTVTNGGAGASAPTAVSFFATAPGWGDTYIGSAFVGPLTAGATAPASISWNTLGFYGSVPVRAVVDSYARVLESNEGNNVSASSLAIASMPDLQVTDLSSALDPEIVSGQAAELHVEVSNLGQAAAGPGAVVQLYDGEPGVGPLIGQTSIGSVAGTGHLSATIPWAAASSQGLHNLVAVVDNNAAVTESNESNNRRSFPVYIGLAAPLAIDSGAASDTSFAAPAGWGAVDVEGDDLLSSCGGSQDDSFRLDPSGAATYRFDNLLPGHAYHLDVVLFECGQGAGRVQSLAVDGTSVAGPVNLGDGEVHRLSVLLDPAVYADRSIHLSVLEEGGLGAVVNRVTLHDIDYRHADAGATNESSYALSSGARRFGWLDGSRIASWGTLPFQTGRSDLLDNDVRYRFDGLVAGRSYDVQLGFFQGTGANRNQEVLVDGLLVRSGIVVTAGEPQTISFQLPPASYAGDSSVEVAVRRVGATAALVSEIALEERTTLAASGTKLQFSQQPIAGAAGLALSGQPSVSIHDDANALVSTDSQTQVSLAVVSGPGALVCAGGLTVEASGGIAQFAGCAVTVPGTYTLRATSLPGLAPADSSPLTASSGAMTSWYFAEGYTDQGWSTRIQILNANASPTQVQISYLLASGPSVVRSLTVPAQTQATVDANDVAQIGPGHAFGLRVHSALPIAVEEQMFAGSSGDFAHSTTGAATPGLNWYFGEGFTQAAWQTFVLLANPTGSDAQVNVKYGVQDGSAVTKTVALPAGQRATLLANLDVPNSAFATSVTSSSPIVAELAMYDSGRMTAHRVSGVPSPSTTWYLAEGFTGSGWETYISVSNPSTSPATVTARYLLDGLPPETRQISVPAGSRGTFVAQSGETGVGVDRAFGVEVTSNVAIVVQEVMIDPALGSPRATSVVASPTLAQEWSFAGGSTVLGAISYYTVANPGLSVVSAQITYYFMDGTLPLIDSESVPAGGRVTFQTGSGFPSEKVFGAVVTTSGGTVVVGEAVYDEPRGRAYGSSGIAGP